MSQTDADNGMIKYTRDQAKLKNTSITRFYIVVQMYILKEILGPVLSQVDKQKQLIRDTRKPVPSFQVRNGPKSV